MGLNTTPATFSVSEVVTAAKMNTEIRDAITGIQAAWTAYTPALTASTTSPTLGTGSSTQGLYQQIGKNVWGSAEVVFGTSGVVAGSGNYSISLPVAFVSGATTAGRVIGDGIFFDNSAAAAASWYQLILIAVTSTTARMVIQGSGILGAAIPVVPAASDQIRIQFLYQAA